MRRNGFSSRGRKDSDEEEKEEKDEEEGEGEGEGEGDGEGGGTLMRRGKKVVSIPIMRGSPLMVMMFVPKTRPEFSSNCIG